MKKLFTNKLLEKLQKNLNRWWSYVKNLRGFFFLGCSIYTNWV